jgi:hypothetical protein
VAASVVAVLLVVAAAVVLLTGAGVESLGPVIVFAVAAAVVLGSLLERGGESS